MGITSGRIHARILDSQLCRMACKFEIYFDPLCTLPDSLSIGIPTRPRGIQACTMHIISPHDARES